MDTRGSNFDENYPSNWLTFLRTNGIRHYVDSYGWPVVTRAAVEGERDKAQDRQPWKPRKAA